MPEEANQSREYKHLNIVDTVGNMPGANRESDTLEVVLTEEIDASVSQGTIGLLAQDGSRMNPASEGTLSSELSREIATWSAGTLPVEQQTPVEVGTYSGGTLPVEQQTAVEVGTWSAGALDVSAATVTADVQDRTARDLGKVRLQDSGGTLIGQSNPQHVVNPSYGDVSMGQQTVAASGTAEALNGGTSLSVPQGGVLRITNLPSNTDTVYVGDSTVSTSNGFALGSTATTPVPLNVADVSSVYVDATSAGDGVSWIVEQ